MAFWKAESKLYRLGVLVASLDDFLGIVQANERALNVLEVDDTARRKAHARQAER